MIIMIKQLQMTALHPEAELSLVAKRFPAFRPMHPDKQYQLQIRTPVHQNNLSYLSSTTDGIVCTHNLHLLP